MTAATTTTSVPERRETVPLTRSHLALLVSSGLLTLAAGAGLPSLVIAVLAWRRNQDDHAGAKRLTHIGWIVFTVFFAVAAIGGIAAWLSSPEGQDFWDWEVAAEVTGELVPIFIKTTLLITVLGTAIATTVGLLLAVATQVLPRFLAPILRWVMDFIRMTPLIVQLMFVYMLIPPDWNMMWAGTVVIGVHYAMYMAESYIAGIGSVDKGQWEAATSLSLPTPRTWRAIVLPQALRATLPSLGNWAISMFKDTPFLFAVSVVEMVTAANQYGNNTFRYNEAYTIAGLLFLVASLITAVAVRKLEKSLVY